MAYDAKNATEGEGTLPKDSILDGVITIITDGKVKDFVKNVANWQGSIEQPAIEMSMDVKVGEEVKQTSQIYTYNNENGKTVYSPNSNLGKHMKKYGKLPETGDQVKILTNADGFGKIKLD